MTNDKAKREAKKRWGNRAYLSNNGHFSSPERRETARTTHREAKAEIEAIDKEIKKRLDELEWFREFTKRKAELRKIADKARGESIHYRFSVGKNNGMFNLLLGQGDTWEQAFEAADKSSRT